MHGRIERLGNCFGKAKERGGEQQQYRVLQQRHTQLFPSIEDVLSNLLLLA